MNFKMNQDMKKEEEKSKNPLINIFAFTKFGQVATDSVVVAVA